MSGRSIRHMANPAGRRQTGVVSAHYRAPGWFTRNVFNRAVAFSTHHGVSILGSRVGRCGEGTCQRRMARHPGQLARTRRTPLPGVSARSRSLGPQSAVGRHRRTAGRQARRSVPESRAHRRREGTGAAGIPDTVEGKGQPVFDGIGPDSSDEQLRAIAADHPTFEVFPVA
jgi:hypothetical protein